MLIIIDRQDGGPLQTYRSSWTAGISIAEVIEDEFDLPDTLFTYEELASLICNINDEIGKLDPARNRTTHGAERHTCPSCGANMVEVAPGRLHCECGEEVVG